MSPSLIEPWFWTSLTVEQIGNPLAEKVRGKLADLNP